MAPYVFGFVLLVFAFLGWLAYVAYRDPAGIFKPKRPPGDDEPPAA
ncbi:hypothetical protein [Sandarakinorhabdus sp. DWP1-3-1]